MSDTPRQVLLVASIDAVGIARLPSLFSGAGYEVFLLGSDHMAVSKSRFVSHRISCPRGVNVTAAALRGHLVTHPNTYDSVVIADEPTLLAVLQDDSNEWLKGWCPVPITHQHIQRLQSKAHFLLDSREAGIKTPRFEVCVDETQLRAAVGRMGFPLFVKGAQGFAGSGLLFARTSADLEGQLTKVEFGAPVLVEEEIAGDTGSIPVIYDRGNPICWFAYRMKHTWPTRFSSACTVAISDHREVESLVRNVGRLTEFHGLCGIDWMTDGLTGRIVLLEFNPRPLPTAYLGPYAGVDFSKALQTIGSAECVVQMPDRSGAVIDMFPQALYYSLEHRELGRTLRAFHDAPWSDPLLTAAHLRRVITHHIPGSVKGMFKNS
jgi:predicted ATP-grasp superfamily ATP-dependent carboligase